MKKAVKKRSYQSAVRMEQAAQTRLRIIDAADELFRMRSFAGTSVAEIAKHAGVAADTVYATFGSKGRLLTAIIDAKLAGPSQVSSVLDRPEPQAIKTERNQRRQIAMFAKDIANVVERVGPMFEVMRSAAASDPEMDTIYREMEGYRASNMRVFAKWIAANGKPRVSLDHAAVTLWTLASPDAHRLLRDVRGWSKKQYVNWLEDSLILLLLPDSRRKSNRA